MTNNFQQAPFLREQRVFPNDDLNELARQTDEAYIDIAQKVNLRIIGVYTKQFPVLCGESWYLTGSRTEQQTFRRVYSFTSTGSITHGINPASISQFTKCSGEYTDGTNYYGALFASNVAIAGQVSFYVTSANIVIIAGVGAPAILSGTIVLEWLSVF